MTLFSNRNPTATATIAMMLSPCLVTPSQQHTTLVINQHHFTYYDTINQITHKQRPPPNQQTRQATRHCKSSRRASRATQLPQPNSKAFPLLGNRTLS
jgi:hypothetical protein